MTSIEDHVAAGLALLTADTALKVYDGEVPDSPAAAYVLVYAFRQLPDGTVAADRGVSLVGTSAVVDMRLFCHCVGTTAAQARWVQSRVEAALLDVTPVISGRGCFPIRWVDGEQTIRNQETLVGSFDQVDIYGWSSVPG